MKISLPDGKKLEYPFNTEASQIAGDISKSLLKDSVAVEINGKLCDIYTKITNDATIKFITTRDPEGLEIIRHDTAHVLAQAIKNLFPKVQITIGPVIENGFYYDVLSEHNFSTEDLTKLEKEMLKISNQNLPIRREIWNRNEAIKFFKGIGENFKAEIISDLPEDEEISLYRQGDFLDLCRGPHAISTNIVKHFKLMKVSGAYWRGDSKNVVLQRIYGTAWATKKDLDDYLYMLEEAEKRDHRKLAKQLDLFHIQEEAPGMIFWHPKGWTVYRILQNHIREKLARHYHEVKTPVLLDKELWEKSGHWEKFRENMFTAETEDKVMAMKPMSCPCHIEIFKRDIRSYRDLPMRFSEFGHCHRNEPSGSLHGLLRVRGFVQDDGHIFCTEEQITAETISFMNLLMEVYKELGFENIAIKFSDRPEVRAGTDKVWDQAEESLKKAIEASGFEYTINKGEGAFYGPKLEFQLKDTLGRQWQCGTIQVDFVLPERLGASYITEEGTKKTPAMLHRAILGSMERFFGILTENHAGAFPVWLAPVQVVVLTINNEIDDYASQIHNSLIESGIRSTLDISNEKINYKIREHSMQKVPFLLVLGRNEKEAGSITIRKFGSNDQISYENIESFKNYLNKLINTRSKDY